MTGKAEILRCPRCLGSLCSNDAHPEVLFCTTKECPYAVDGFPVISDKPALIDFPNSIIEREALHTAAGSSPIMRDLNRKSLRNRITRIVIGTNKAAERYAIEIVRLAKETKVRPRILVIGGGAIGNGAGGLYSDESIELVGTDIYASPNIHVIADGHQLPFADETFNGVWIQAVLEHVLDPARVVAEIRRVLVSGGLVFATIPFMQQVHEGAYDFTRFTMSGHRWLFRSFELIAAGVTQGAGTAFFWSIRYLIRALTGSATLAKVLAFPFFWLRFLDQFTVLRPNADSASGTYFFGRKCDTLLSPKEMVTFYENQRRRYCASKDWRQSP